MAAATTAAVNDGDNGRGAMAVEAEKNCWGPNGSTRASMVVTVKGDSNDSLSKNSCEITAK